MPVLIQCAEISENKVLKQITDHVVVHTANCVAKCPQKFVAVVLFDSCHVAKELHAETHNIKYLEACIKGRSLKEKVSCYNFLDKNRHQPDANKSCEIMVIC